MAKSGRYSADRKKIEALSADKTVEVADCGTIFTLDGTTALTITLPSSAAAGRGWWCKFVLNADDNGTDHVITRSSDDSNNIHVVGVCAADGAAGQRSDSTPQLKITLEGANSEIGDQYEFITDGEKWFLTAITAAADAFQDATS